MSELAPLISDLALILICAGVMTLVFKRLKQPLVLGYIVAGFLASPHVPLTPSVIDVANIHTWSEIGVIFLLFALGLEFSFKKLVKVGGTAVIAACTIIFCMILVGIFVGWSFGWQRMDCLYLGGMLAMSSTTIIYKAFDDLGLRQQRFAGLVLSILILEDILAIVLMVMLSTMAVSQNFEGSEMVYSIAKLLFFLILWFVVGIYIIPTFLKRSRKWMANETLLIVSLALCFGMVVVAAKVGFSAAFGAFIYFGRNGRGRKYREACGPCKGFVWSHFLCICGNDGRPCHDCRIYMAHCDYYIGHSAWAGYFWYRWRDFVGTAVESCHAMWLQSDPDW